MHCGKGECRNGANLKLFQNREVAGLLIFFNYWLSEIADNSLRAQHFNNSRIFDTRGILNPSGLKTINHLQ